MMEPKGMEERRSDLLREIAEKEKGNLRFGARFLPVSEIASQYYCEKKVEMSRIFGRKETSEMKNGKEAHEFLLKDSAEAGMNEILDNIHAGGRIGVREMPLLGEHRGVIIAGVTDAVFFHKRTPLFLFEHKFSSRQIPFYNYHVQARLYCYLLHLMGWSTSELKYALIIALPKLKSAVELADIPSQVLERGVDERGVVDLAGGNVGVYINRFEQKKATDDLDWALGFWKEERDAMPTKKPAKCRVCEFKRRCFHRFPREPLLVRRA